jgi:DeoR family transcriptional regulator, aga operon transcriptional repressor
MKQGGMGPIEAPRLLIEERRRRILELLEKNDRVTVGKLIEEFGISAVTIRSDLDALDEQGALQRSHGGALKRLNPLQDYPLKVKETLHHFEKVRIAQAALTFTGGLSPELRSENSP